MAGLITRTRTQVWITDSCPMQAELVNGKGPFEVLSLAPLIASQIDLELDVSRTGVPSLPLPACHCALHASFLKTEGMRRCGVCGT
jgi:hypothetical protein